MLRGGEKVTAEPVSIGPLGLPGSLVLPPAARGLVLFVHGSGSSRTSPRNRAVAQALQRGSLATLLFDLLSESEAASRENVFDIDMLAQRVVQAIDWLRSRADTAASRLGLFGASTGAAAALVAGSQRAGDVAAIVSRGGRPDLAGAALADVRAPTLLIVGGLDAEVLQLNRQALQRLKCEKRLELVPRATHLFAEAGALETVAALALDWFSARFDAAH
jgi:putative phosphoribosyl transferase